MSILVTGGAGYIGSVTVQALLDAGESVVVLDNFSRGHRAALDGRAAVVEGDVGDAALVASAVAEHGVEACIHFAAFALVSESVAEPELYYSNNLAQGLSLLASLHAGGVSMVVFSSSCATYGEPQQVPIAEDHPQRPCHPYGWTKLLMEKALMAYDHAHGMRSVALRYFNAAGAVEGLGEDHTPETHLIPNAIRTALGVDSELLVFGDNFPTPDGTAIRDYVHVSDLARAHMEALKLLRAGCASDAFNLGTGKGHSVMEVIAAISEVSGREVRYRLAPPREGDPASLVADSSRARSCLGWEPKDSDMESMAASAWRWHESHPNGYPPELA